MRDILRAVTAGLCLLAGAGFASGRGNAARKLPRTRSISQYGMTWTFEKPVRVGRFVTGDYYVDRWMHQDDTEPVKEIERVHGKKMGVRQGSTAFDPWTDAMWARYRRTLQPPPDGWKPKGAGY